jgi:hypothetical protein
VVEGHLGVKVLTLTFSIETGSGSGEVRGLMRILEQVLREAGRSEA